MDMIAADAPFLKEEDGPAVHAHGADGQDESDRPRRLSRQLNLTGDFVAHHRIEVGQRAAGHWFETRMPPGLPICERAPRNLREAVDSFKVPTGGKESFHHGAAKRG